MIKLITKVKKNAREKSKEGTTGWRAVLDDIQTQIERLQRLIPIVERKIECNEPWPGMQSRGQNSEQQHSD